MTLKDFRIATAHLPGDTLMVQCRPDNDGYMCDLDNEPEIGIRTVAAWEILDQLRINDRPEDQEHECVVIE